MNDDSWALQHFKGTVRMFPLPNVVLFPQVVQPLHIFEPRYRQMTAEALEDDRLIAPVLLQPGWEADYEGRPAIFSITCVGRIIAEQRLPDGRYNLLLRGLSRARIVEELPKTKLYRSARVELQPGGDPPNESAARDMVRVIAESTRRWFPPEGTATEQMEKLLRSQLPLGLLCDLLAFAVPLAVEAKQQLLEQLDIEKRAQLLVEHLQQDELPKPAPKTDRLFPPNFSSN
jgi:Lon protease-like protein